MAILIGIIFLALGISLAVVQWDSFVVVLQSVLALGFMFWGGIALLVGYSEMKARREYTDAVKAEDGTAPAESQTRNPQSPLRTDGSVAGAATAISKRADKQ